MRRFWIALIAVVCGALPADAHIGSPDVFYDGPIGSYVAHIAIRPPPVVPGRARIEVRVRQGEVESVSFLPLFARTRLRNTPPADITTAAPGEPEVYRGELWLMSAGEYSIQVTIHGKPGDGVIEIPVRSVAMHQLPMPPQLKAILLALGSLLFAGATAIASVAAGQSTVAPGASIPAGNSRNAFIAGGAAALTMALVLYIGWSWWLVEEAHFKRHLREGAWPDMKGAVTTDGAARTLILTIGESAFPPDYALPLMPDHGKLLHLFLVKENSFDAFAHLHPVRTGDRTFRSRLPPLEAGRYKVFCELTLADNGISSTASCSIDVPKPATPPGDAATPTDPDDSWAPIAKASPAASSGSVCRFADGGETVWLPHGPLRPRQDARLSFDVRDSAGNPLPLEPYMGMASHAAVVRLDGKVFAHLHPSGNYSMAAQSYFATKAAAESPEGTPAAIDHSSMRHSLPSGAEGSRIDLPYEFPAAGKYRIWVQVKSGGRILTAAFDADVADG